MSAQISTPERGPWLRLLLTGRPHQVVASARGVYLYRWYVIPRNRLLNIYVHKFVGSDDAPALHNHPWWFASVIVRGSYREVTERGARWRRPGDVAARRAGHRHRIELLRAGDGGEHPCVSVVVTGPRRHPWGFFCPGGQGDWRFIAWSSFDGGGCGEVTDRAAAQPLSRPADREEVGQHD